MATECHFTISARVGSAAKRGRDLEPQVNRVAPHRDIAKFADREGFAPFVSLDFHTRRQFFPLAMSVSLPEPLSPVSLIAAIRGGHCRAEFLGCSALRFTGGFEGATLRALEAARRGVRGPLSRLQAAAHR